jgi:hypothetical protein
MFILNNIVIFLIIINNNIIGNIQPIWQKHINLRKETVFELKNWEKKRRKMSNSNIFLDN